MGCAEPGAAAEVTRRAVLAALREAGRWLLVFDNAEQPADVLEWLPGGGGHVLITSREQRWAEVAVPVEVDVLARAESVAMLQARVPALAEADADDLAAALGDLPLAVAQAAGYLPGSGLSAAAYLKLLGTRAAEVLDLGKPVSYPRSLAAATGLSVDQLAGEDPAAAQLISVCAFLAPEPVPQDLFTTTAARLPDPLAGRAGDPLAWPQLLARLATRSLARVEQDGLQLHRLTQAIVRDRLSPARAATARASAEAVLAAYDPGSAEDPAAWPRWARLLPHLLAADPAATTSLALRNKANSAAWYLLMRGDTRLGLDLADRLYQRWRSQLGGDDPATLRAATSLGEALRRLGRYAAARELDEDSLTRRRRLYGDDHVQTLASAGNLAVGLRALGEVQAPGTWTKTPWTGAAGCSARTTPTPCAPPATSPPTWTDSAKPMLIPEPRLHTRAADGFTGICQTHADEQRCVKARNFSAYSPQCSPAPARGEILALVDRPRATELDGDGWRDRWGV